MDILGSDPYLNFILEAFEERKVEFQNADKIRDKSKIINECDMIGLAKYFEVIENMSDDEFDEYKENRKKSILELIKQNQKAFVKGFQDKLTSEEGAALALSLEPEEHFISNVDKVLEEKLSTTDYSRFFVSEFLSKIELHQLKSSLVIELLPLFQLTDILKRNFSFDENWAFAVSILAIQESLVKKKLLELGMTETDLNNFLNKEGKHFPNLIDELANRIKTIENRNVSLTFFKSSGMRDMRNRMEHEGYKTQVCKDEIPDLLKEIEKFENELFPKN